MVDAGDADGLISGLTQHYPDTIRPALQIIGTRAGRRSASSGVYILMLKDRTFFFADTTVNIDPTAEELAEIAILTADAARRFDVEPRVAMLSFSNFGSNAPPDARARSREAVEIVRERAAGAGDRRRDAGRHRGRARASLQETYPFAAIAGRRERARSSRTSKSANIAYKLSGASAAPRRSARSCSGWRKPVHVLQRGVEVTDIVNMAAIAVVDAQEKAKESDRLAAPTRIDPCVGPDEGPRARGAARRSAREFAWPRDAGAPGPGVGYA